MRPTAAQSSHLPQHHPRSSSTPISSTTSPVYHQQQQFIYAPISSSLMALQPCGTTFHPSYIYPNIQPHVGSLNSAAIHFQGKNNRWHSKNKPSHGPQHYQQQFSYNSKPMVHQDQPASSTAPLSPSTSFLVTSSTLTHGPMPNERYNNSGVTLLSQPYLKPSEVQAFCLIQDKQNAQQQQQHPMHASYYNISATNTCSLQTVNANSFPFPNLNSYNSLSTFTNNQFPASMPSSSFFSNPSIGLVIAPPKDKPSSLSPLGFSPVRDDAGKIFESRFVSSIHNDSANDWSRQIEIPSKNLYDIRTANNDKNSESTDIIKIDEGHYSDESSVSFDFSIEAEKMVSALCNTTSSNDLGKEESKVEQTDTVPLFSGAGDNISNKTSWFTDFHSESENGRSIGVQTNASYNDMSQYPDLIRKTAYWGCTEAEIVLSSDNTQTDTKRSWLTRISSATKTAITKSSTCIPVFAGNQIFVNDLINALLRISNGWLSLDNYLNKQHFPNLLDKLDSNFISCFHTWEENTYELLKQIVQTFQKFGENEGTDIEQKYKETFSSSSFPGDVSLYTSCDLFTSLLSCNQQNTTRETILQGNPSSDAPSIPKPKNILRNFQYNSDQQEQLLVNHKESKLRSKWTITENSSSVINNTKSAPNVAMCRAEVVSLANNNSLRPRDASSKKLNSASKSLNAEFVHLKNKVMESNTDTVTQLKLKDRQQESLSANKLTEPFDKSEYTKLHNSTTNTPMSYTGLYAQNYLSFTFPSSNHLESSYRASNPEFLTYSGPSCPSSESYSIIDSNFRNSKISDQIYSTKCTSNVNSVYTSGSQIKQIELPAVPRNKVTLLSQIEPRIFNKKSEEMATNLSAWFASMRNVSPIVAMPTFAEPRINGNSSPQLITQQDMPKYSVMNISQQSQVNGNRQFQEFQNLQNTQNTPWAASSLVGSIPQEQHSPEEYDSSEDVRIYMKPGSYNVPKKRHQKRPSHRSDNNTMSRNVHANNHLSVCGNKKKNISVPASSTPLPYLNESALSTNINNSTLIKTSFPAASQLPAPLFNSSYSPRILKRTEPLPQNNHKDIAWKAACVSAEILLEALNVQGCDNMSRNLDCIENKNGTNEYNTEALSIVSQCSDPKSTKYDDINFASSYEVSEDDLSSACTLSPTLSIKTNVKTDSWLIRTLNNASFVSKQKQFKDHTNRQSSKSSNSSETIDAQADQLALSSTDDVVTKISAITIDSEYPAIFSRKHSSDTSLKNETSTKSLENYVGRATYSETVQRSMKSHNSQLETKEPYQSSCAIKSSIPCNSVVPISGRKNQRKNHEQSYQFLHKSRKATTGKKSMRNMEKVRLDDESCERANNGKPSNGTLKSPSTTKIQGKRKYFEHSEGRCTGKSGDRGWSVWYSSRKKQNLSPLALSKLETIHQTIWQMDEAKMFKYSLSCSNKDGQTLSAGMIEDYCKIVKSPMFLEVIDYKLKNRAYHKIEHVIKDFRRIIHNARLYHQHDDERAKKIEVLSKKLEGLFEEHFGNWNLDNVVDSATEDSPVRQRVKTSGAKSMASRYDGAKKNASSLIIAETSSFH